MLVLNVAGMSCNHCVRAVESAIKQLDDKAQVKVDLALSTVTVDSQLSADVVIQAIDAEGYKAQLI